ncbi:MAG TPA: MGMT family protein [Candidatus Omnitrophica bacterium]|nr:MAG: hypothetical protein DRP61_04615 [Candidatus Omnitrophota bacterium]RKY35549.1 MAG: hypothetical protein DRP69_01100 [Candidatus Omnitrophota bacterium]RKY44477.1 MAG: hypothetical protein DRP80_02205 [Candidatus Omnitrophota bacterium]HEC69905.1 MGMT family protein [Candidatus Omnitrophota bacterium]
MRRSKRKRLTGFEKKVLKCVAKIPLGEVRSYKWVAKKIGKPNAFRAVGRVLNKNPFPFFIPCHRVIKSNQDIGGYSLGKNLKKELLELEKAIKKSLFTPHHQRATGVNLQMKRKIFRRVMSKSHLALSRKGRG